MARRARMEALTQLLDLEGFEVLEMEEDRTQRVRRLGLVPTVDVGLCPHCHRSTDHRHQSRERTVQDLPWGRYTTQLTIRLPQYQCPHCGTVFTPSFPVLAEGAHATERFLERLAEMVRWSDLKNAAAFFGLPEKTLEHWYYAYVERRPTARPSDPIRSLGIDELARKKNAGVSAAC
jgi:transposase